MLKKPVSKTRGNEAAGAYFQYVRTAERPRTPLTGFFSILLKDMRRWCRVIACVAVTAMSVGSPAQAEKLYVSGHREIMLRTGPSGQHKILAVLETGDEMTRLETNGNYYRVSLPNGQRGYVLKTFVAAEPPPEHRMQQLERRVKAQTEQLQELRYENAQLKEASAQIAREASARERLLQELEQERAEFRRNTNLWWFLAGAGVLLVGWFMGWTRLRSSRRSRRGSLT